MADISTIKLGGTVYNIKDAKAARSGIFYVAGTQTAATGAWTGNLPEVDALYNGLTIAYWLPYAGSGNATLNLTLKNGATGAINCYYKGNTRLTTHYGAGDMIILTYHAAGAVKVAGTATSDARWTAAQNYVDGNSYPSVYSGTAAATAAKVGTLTNASWSGLTGNRYLQVTMYYDNTAASALTLNVNSQGAKPIYINGAASSASNYTLPRGTYIVYYNGTNFYFRTDGKIPQLITSGSLTRSNIGSASAGAAIAADDITAWTTNTPTTITYTARSIPNVTAAGTASVANGVLTITNTTLGTAIAADDITAYTAGTAASLSYTARSIPNISVTSTAVVTGEVT